MRKNGVEDIPLPDLGESEYLVGYWMDIGATLPGAMGEVPLTWSEIAAWQDRAGVPLMPWEARILRALSREYLAERRAATDDYGRVAPYGVSTEQQRAATALALKQSLSAVVRADTQAKERAR